MLPWYCVTSREHRHSTEWEAEACSELYELWQMATAQLIAYVREDEVDRQVNEALWSLSENFDGSEEEQGDA